MATLWVRNKGSVIVDGRAVKRRHDIIQVDPDHAPVGWMSTSRGRDQAYASGQFIHLRVHVPGLNHAVKAMMEAPVVKRSDLAGEFVEPQEEVLHQRSYYLDVDALPEWARQSLETHGEATLSPADAVRVIKRRTDNATDPILFQIVHD
jgi:hypothetical protein